MSQLERQIHYIFNLKFGKPSLWERIILLFCALHFSENEVGRVAYKYFWDRLYIYTQEYKNPALPAPSIEVPWTGGVEKPWTN